MQDSELFNYDAEVFEDAEGNEIIIDTEELNNMDDLEYLDYSLQRKGNSK